MKVTVVGTGYVGLVSGACLSEVGNDVLCLDLDPEKIRILKEGGIPIHEPGLDAVVARVESLPPDGFMISCFPVKVHRGSAGWTRAVAIIEE